MELCGRSIGSHHRKSFGICSQGRKGDILCEFGLSFSVVESNANARDFYAMFATCYDGSGSFVEDGMVGELHHHHTDLEVKEEKNCFLDVKRLGHLEGELSKCWLEENGAKSYL